LLTERASIYGQILQKSKGDDITSELMDAPVESREVVIQRELKKYDALSKKLEENVQEQDRCDLEQFSTLAHYSHGDTTMSRKKVALTTICYFQKVTRCNQ
tara:strand:+ start:879 stop:1181 length:303 start_codon:yes stop_codon:yes gene_type:complete